MLDSIETTYSFNSSVVLPGRLMVGHWNLDPEIAGSTPTRGAKLCDGVI